MSEEEEIQEEEIDGVKKLENIIRQDPIFLEKFNKVKNVQYTEINLRSEYDYIENYLRQQDEDAQAFLKIYDEEKRISEDWYNSKLKNLDLSGFNREIFDMGRRPLEEADKIILILYKEILIQMEVICRLIELRKTNEFKFKEKVRDKLKRLSKDINELSKSLGDVEE